MNKGSQSQSDSNWGKKHENSAVEWQKIIKLMLTYIASILLPYLHTLSYITCSHDTVAYSKNSIVSKLWSNQKLGLGYVWIVLFEFIYWHKYLRHYLEELKKITSNMFMGCFQLISITSLE
jgi:hypothetical protein